MLSWVSPFKHENKTSYDKYDDKIHSFIAGVSLTSLATCGSETQQNVTSAAMMTSLGVRPCSAPAFTKSSHCEQRGPGDVTGRQTMLRAGLHKVVTLVTLGTEGTG